MDSGWKNLFQRYKTRALFMISRWSRSILLALFFFVEFVWRKDLQLPWRFVLVNCTSKEQSRGKKHKRRLQVGLGVTELLNLQLIYFPMSYGTIYICFYSRFCRICFDRAMARSFVFQLISDGPDAWTRREFYICELHFPTWAFFFCLTSLILLKQIFLSPSWVMIHSPCGREE